MATLNLGNILEFINYLCDRTGIDSVIFFGNVSGISREDWNRLLGTYTVKVYNPTGYKKVIDRFVAAVPFSPFLGLRMTPELISRSLIIFIDSQEEGSRRKLFISGRFEYLSAHAPLAIRVYPNDSWKERIGGIKERVILGNGVAGDLEIDGSTYIKLSGRHITPTPTPSNLKILAIVTVYNEEDIIEHTIRHLINEGLSVHLIDNWSTDSSLEKIIKAHEKYPDLVTYEQYPEEPSEEYNLDYMLAHVEEIAKNSGADWAMHNDADELRVSPWNGVKLVDAFGYVDSLGYNCLDFTVFNFVPTEDGYNGDQTPQSFFKYGDFGRHPGHFIQIKAWKIDTDQLVNLSRAGGHELDFPNRRVYPLKFFMKHYQLRSSAHAYRKIFKERLPRYSKRNRARGWHNHYDKVRREEEFIKNPEDLIPYNEAFDVRYMIPRLSGIGVKKDTV